MKRLIALILSIIIIFSSIPMVSAVAEEINDTTTENTTDAGLNNVSVTSTNSFSSLLSGELEDAAQKEESASNAILDCKIEGNIASIKVANLVACKIIVSIYDEDTNNMITSGMANIEAQAVNVDVELNANTLPEYYLVKVFMLDENNKPLIEAYECDRYTKSYQEFLALTVDDFEDKNVLQLDETDKSNNFGVYEDDVKIIPSSDKNIYSYENSTDSVYVFTNINEDISSLQVGDIVSYTYNDEELIFKIKTITVENSTATIEKDETLVLDEVFSCLKIISDPQTYSPATYNTRKSRSLDVEEECDELDGVKLSTSLDKKNNSLTLGIEVNTDLTGNEQKNEKIEISCEGKATGSASVTLTNTACFEIYDDGERKYFDIGTEVEFSSSLTLSGKTNVEISLFEITPIPLGSTGLLFEFEIGFVFKSSAVASVEKTQTTQISITYNAKTEKAKFNNYLLEEAVESKKSLNFEGEVFIGLKISPAISFLEEVAKITLSAETGIKISGSLVKGVYKGHKCTRCIAGDFHFIIVPSLEIKIIGFEWIIEQDAVTLELKICDWYDSNIYGSDFGVCPGLMSNEDYISSLEPVSVVNHDQGKCGENVRYKFDNGKLKIHGTGPMYAEASQFWETYKEYIYEVIIGEGVTTLGTHAFEDCFNLRTIVLPSTLKDIGYSSFMNCENLRAIDIPYGVESIGIRAFAGCSILTSLTLPDTVNTIKNDFCNGCVLLKEVYLPSEVENFYAWSAFHGCQELESVVLPKNIKQIENGMFSECYELKSIIIPDGVTKILGSAFFHCKNLTEVHIPKSVIEIGPLAFKLAFPNEKEIDKNVYYYGTEEDWKKITIWGMNTEISEKATLHFMGDTVVTEEIQMFSSNRSFNLLSQNTENSANYENKDIVRTELVPNSYYVVMILKGTLENYTVDNDSLLYIDGAYSDNDGTVGFDVYYEDTDEDTIAAVFGECNHEYGDAEVVKEPSQSSEGLQGQVCSKCGEVINAEVITKLPSIVYLDDVNVFSGTEYTLPNSNEKGFVAYTDGESYFEEGETIELVGDINLTTLSIGTVSMVKGASIRLNEVQGMRFYTNIDTTKIDALRAQGFDIQTGTLIAPENLLGEEDLTFDLPYEKYIDVKYDSLDYYVEKSFKGIVGSIVDIKEHNINRNFVGRGYVKISFGNTEKIIYADYSENDINNNTRSISYVATCYKNDTSSSYDSLSVDFKELVDKWAYLYTE